MTTEDDTTKKRKLKVLVITMGGSRQQQIQNMFENLDDHFEPPVFSPGVPQRDLRNRYKFLYWANEAGLLPKEEWAAIDHANATANYNDGPMCNTFFDCLNGIEVKSGRRGSPSDVKLHYSVELWRKGRALNRGRAVLACSWAHLIAMRKLTEDHSFDMILEDNVRTLKDGDQLSKRIWDTVKAKADWESECNEKCHLLYHGWLGSVTNLEWICQIHAPKRMHSPQASTETSSIFPFPLQEHLDEDLADWNKLQSNEVELKSDSKKSSIESEEKNKKYQHSLPGGNPIWGMYAYWISSDGYAQLMKCLCHDVGAMLWKGKRARAYSVKPIDKIVPRQLIALTGPQSVQLTTHPSFFRAPMLTSKIHTQWDPEFCKSTTYQMHETALEWSDLGLEPTEKDVVDNHAHTGEWLTPAVLRQRDEGETT
ncbi:hypothetical protein IV203_032869 [Nitzschia inconspicua]|uniref:Uncharacterized protein n=1 Tax=Nitzschia inconspicua TaxID=303405 RepID=A0A9K3KKE7_9STRA|nr:hypothetical protein IV203_032869 [Nitzschia inconspicua]